MKKLVLIPLVVLVALGALSLPVSSQTSDGVEAVVTPFGVAIRIDDGPVNFGTLNLSPADDNRTVAPSGTIIVHNDGSAPADLMIQGSHGIPTEPGDTQWTLDCSDENGFVATNRFALLFAFPDDPIDWPLDGDSLCPDATKPLQSGVGGGGSSEFVLQMNMPTGSGGFSARTTTVTVTATQQN